MASRSFAFALRKYLRFSVREIEEVLTIALIFGFVLSFRDWGVDSFDYVAGAGNLLQGFLVVLGSFLIVLLVQKMFAIAKGLSLEHKVWTRGLIGSLLFGLFSNGLALVFLSSSFTLKRVQRVGYASKDVDLSDLAKCAGAGLLMHASLVGVGAMVVSMTDWYWADRLIVFNAVYLAYNVLPLPQIVGSMIFLVSRVWYAFVFFAAIGFVLLALVGVPSFIFALSMGLIAAGLFFYWYEQHWI